MLDKEIVNTFIINRVLVKPIEEIVSKLKNHEYRDCDIVWLDNKLESFVKFAAETLEIKVVVPNEVMAEKYDFLNNYVIDIYLSKFNNLLNYFKQLNQ